MSVESLRVGVLAGGMGCDPSPGSMSIRGPGTGGIAALNRRLHAGKPAGLREGAGRACC
ncbi:MAG TPA: hypothetical protein VEC99_11545 [Clostridia bacterium]|nr:hypothetical protein [Clostridia bacterium]